MASTSTNAVDMEVPLDEQSALEKLRFSTLGVYIVLMTANLWIIFSLIHFGIKTRKWRSPQFGNPDSLSSGRIYLSVVVCSVTAFLYNLVVAIYRNVGFHKNEDKLCDTMADLNKIMYGICSFSVVLFLWLRQRTLYTAFLPTARFQKTLKFFSFIIIVVAIVGGLPALILSIMPNDYVASPIGCVYKKNKSYRVPSLVIIATTTVFTQVSLLAVFIHALLVLHKSSEEKRWKSLLCCKQKPLINVVNEQTNITEQPHHRTQTIVRNVIRKTIIFAALSILSDLLITSSLLFARQGNRRDILSLLTTLWVSMNLCFVILSFLAWKDMMTSPCKSFTRLQVVTKDLSQNLT